MQQGITGMTRRHSRPVGLTWGVSRCAVIDLDEQALADAAAELGTTTKVASTVGTEDVYRHQIRSKVLAGTLAMDRILPKASA